MNYDWELFIKKWEKQFNDAKHILRYLNTYPQWTKDLRIKELNTEKKIENTQKEWLWLLSKLEHPDDIDFLKPWWVMLETNDFNSFIDLSDPYYPIFETKFYDFVKPNWCKVVLFPKISEMYTNIEDDIIIQSQISKAMDEHFKYLTRITQ